MLYNYFEFGPVVQEIFKDISYLELWRPSCLVELNHLCNVLWLFLTVPWDGLQCTCMSVVLPDHIHLLFYTNLTHSSDVDQNAKVTQTQKKNNNTQDSQEVRFFPAGDHKLLETDKTA